jgi:hypothetical protein
MPRPTQSKWSPSKVEIQTEENNKITNFFGGSLSWFDKDESKDDSKDDKNKNTSKSSGSKK